MQKFIRVKEVSKLLGIGRSTVWLWVKEGKLPAPIKLSPRVSVWKLSDIEKFMTESVDGAI